NLRLKSSILAAQFQSASADARLGVLEASERPKTYVIDYSGPNVAKPMHVGHIRSTVIGDALARTLRFLGHTVIGDNHIGDWGTQFGMIIYGYKNFRDDKAVKANLVDELARLYRLVNQLVDYHEAKTELPGKRDEIAKLQQAVERQASATTPTDKKAAKEAERERRRLADKLGEGQERLASIERKIKAVESSPDLLCLAG